MSCIILKIETAFYSNVRGSESLGLGDYQAIPCLSLPLESMFSQHHACRIVIVMIAPV